MRILDDRFLIYDVQKLLRLAQPSNSFLKILSLSFLNPFCPRIYLLFINGLCLEADTHGPYITFPPSPIDLFLVNHLPRNQPKIPRNKVPIVDSGFVWDHPHIFGSESEPSQVSHHAYVPRILHIIPNITHCSSFLLSCFSFCSVKDSWEVLRSPKQGDDKSPSSHQFVAYIIVSWRLSAYLTPSYFFPAPFIILIIVICFVLLYISHIHHPLPPSRNRYTFLITARDSFAQNHDVDLPH